MSQIEDNLLSVFNCAFKDKRDYLHLTDELKDKYFFIINRLFCKKYPIEAQLLNLKNIDKVSSFDLWYYFMIEKPYPKWFWSKTEKSETSEIPEKDYKLLLQSLKLKDIDLDYLIEHNIDFIKEELKYFKDLQKNKLK